jgi:uncharacterized protein (TIGR02284 family)
VSHEPCLEMLKDLIETSRDGERGFALAVRDNREPGVEAVLKDGEESCREAAIELQDQMSLLGGVHERGAAKAPVYRGWINFKAVPIGRGTKLILEECERGGDYAQARYEAVRNLELPESVRGLIDRQYQRLLVLQGRLRVLRNRYPATDIPNPAGYRSDRAR